MAKKRRQAIIAIGAISALVGGAFYIDYKRKKDEAEVARAKYQEELGTAIVAKAQGDRQEVLARQILREAMMGSTQEQRGKAILAQAQEARAQEQEAMGRAIQLKAVADTKQAVANRSAQAIVVEAAKRGVDIDQGDIDNEIKSTSQRNILLGVGVAAVVGTIAYFKYKVK